MGFLVDEGTPIIWRGPMVVSALTQMLRDVDWGELDVLVIDMPPGTGDVQLTMAQQVPLAGAIIVSTPQDLALIDARKGLNMFRKVDVPVLGIIENMSYFVCPKCGERSDIFGHGGAKLEAEKLGIPFLGGVPLHMDIRATSDEGQPIVASSPDSVHAQIYRDIAARAWSELQGELGRAPRAAEARDRPRSRPSSSSTFEGAKPFTLSAEMLRVMSPSAEVQGHSPEQRVTVGQEAQRQDQGAEAGRQLRRAHRLRRRPRHRALRLVLPADAARRARQALGGVPLRAGAEGAEPGLRRPALKAPVPSAALHRFRHDLVWYPADTLDQSISCPWSLLESQGNGILRQSRTAAGRRTLPGRNCAVGVACDRDRQHRPSHSVEDVADTITTGRR